MSNPSALVQKLWNYCNVLRDDSLSYGDIPISDADLPVVTQEITVDLEAALEQFATIADDLQ